MAELEMVSIFKSIYRQCKPKLVKNDKFETLSILVRVFSFKVCRRHKVSVQGFVALGGHFATYMPGA